MFPNRFKPFDSLLSAILLGVVSCTPIKSPTPDWPDRSRQWYDRAAKGYAAFDLADAREAIDQAIKLEPGRDEVRTLAARIALADLRNADAIRQTAGLSNPDALGLRARAFWYSGNPEEAAHTIEGLLQDPVVRDPWAKSVLELARNGRGRKPYTVTGSLLAVMEMPRLPTPAMTVPVNLNGQPVLALINTGQAETTVEAGGQGRGSWVSISFDDRVELKDVPATAADLSGWERSLGVPIKVVLGTHALRHLNATIDYLGRQFVVRTTEPTPPPNATKLDIAYFLGGAMTSTGRIGSNEGGSTLGLFLDTGTMHPLALDEAGWKLTRIPPSALQPVPGSPELKQALVPRFQLGAFAIPNVPVIAGVSIEERETAMGVDLDGILGAGLLSSFRVTIADQGKTVWLEDAPAPLQTPAPLPQATGSLSQ